jgi:hypothetical protein
MGEVYKARDTRLDRIVAVKTSRVQFNGGLGQRDGVRRVSRRKRCRRIEFR